jgi:hypothetical protein
LQCRGRFKGLLESLGQKAYLTQKNFKKKIKIREKNFG